MSGRRTKYLKGSVKKGGLDLTRPQRRLFTRAWLTPPQVLKAMHAALRKLERKRLNRAVARDKRRFYARQRAAAIRAYGPETAPAEL